MPDRRGPETESPPRGPRRTPRPLLGDGPAVGQIVIITANIRFNTDFRTWVRDGLVPRMRRDGLVPGGSEPGIGLVAWVKEGAWSITCPCRGGEYVWEEGWMMCASCWNEWAGHQYIRTMFPTHRAQIEAVLLARPERASRNCLIGQKVADLIQENIDHGVGVPYGLDRTVTT